jgi:hypothetical protein
VKLGQPLYLFSKSWLFMNVLGLNLTREYTKNK